MNAEEPVAEISVKLGKRSQEQLVWVMADGLLVCGCHVAYRSGGRSCPHKLAAQHALPFVTRRVIQ
jgi:hypothetical protein